MFKAVISQIQVDDILNANYEENYNVKAVQTYVANIHKEKK